MKLKSDLSINGRLYRKGEKAPTGCLYPFFLVHMGAFGGSGFLMAYFAEGVDVAFLYMHGGFAILVYLVFYLAIFGREEVRWMFINAALGTFGIYTEIGWLLGLFGKRVGDFPWYVHVIPFLYYVLYTFLLRQALLDLFGAREDPARRRRVERWYVTGSLLVYGTLFVLGRL
ncbi:hypothetical protein [Arenimonas fontis]|uniref:Uncharacterized protein n=1 Tax=Arenimonas fontis TaxID=2608255 RepID=A0A5B2ZDI6_9GAMM|nr:hypothetical protein [Arenimonas fontis]KAA2285091.1 hypothetical protein F0415_07565 [Arenimonas fontis]